MGVLAAFTVNFEYVDHPILVAKSIDYRKKTERIVVDPTILAPKSDPVIIQIMRWYPLCVNRVVKRVYLAAISIEHGVQVQ